jgi:hypothetical protein
MAKTNTRKEILVFAHWLEMKEPMLMGSFKIISSYFAYITLILILIC